MNKSDLKDGMIVKLRKGVTRVVIGKYLFDEQGFTHRLDNYNDDLTHINNCKNEDIMKIEYGDKIIWERGVEWENVPFGTKVRVLDYNDEEQIGRFLMYDKENEDDEFPFFIFIEDEKDTNWYRYCEIIEEGEDE